MTSPARNVLPFPRPDVRYGVYSAEGKLLGTFKTREQAESLCHEGWGRTVRELTTTLECGR